MAERPEIMILGYAVTLAIRPGDPSRYFTRTEWEELKRRMDRAFEIIERNELSRPARQRID